MALIVKNTPEYESLLNLIRKFGRMTQISEGDQVLISLVINTTKKLKTLENWTESKTVDGVLQTDDIQIMNQVARITPAEEMVKIIQKVNEE